MDGLQSHWLSLAEKISIIRNYYVYHGSLKYVQKAYEEEYQLKTTNVFLSDIKDIIRSLETTGSVTPKLMVKVLPLAVKKQAAKEKDCENETVVEIWENPDSGGGSLPTSSASPEKETTPQTFTVLFDSCGYVEKIIESEDVEYVETEIVDGDPDGEGPEEEEEEVEIVDDGPPLETENVTEFAKLCFRNWREVNLFERLTGWTTIKFDLFVNKVMEQLNSGLPDLNVNMYDVRYGLMFLLYQSRTSASNEEMDLIFHTPVPALMSYTENLLSQCLRIKNNEKRDSQLQISEVWKALTPPRRGILPAPKPIPHKPPENLVSRNQCRVCLRKFPSASAFRTHNESTCCRCTWCGSVFRTKLKDLHWIECDSIREKKRRELGLSEELQ